MRGALTAARFPHSLVVRLAGRFFILSFRACSPQHFVSPAKDVNSPQRLLLTSMFGPLGKDVAGVYATSSLPASFPADSFGHFYNFTRMFCLLSKVFEMSLIILPALALTQICCMSNYLFIMSPVVNCLLVSSPQPPLVEVINIFNQSLSLLCYTVTRDLFPSFFVSSANLMSSSAAFP